MNFEIVNTDDSAMLSVTMNNGDEIFTESGAMVTRSPSVVAKASTGGGFLKGLARSLLGGESFFVQRMIASSNGEVLLAPAIPGGIHITDISDQKLLLARGAFLAGEASVDISTKPQKLSKGLFSGTGLFVIEAEGRGKLAMTAFAGIREIDLAAGEEILIDTGHIVGWQASVAYKIETDGGFLNSIGTGEVLVCRFKGPGKVWIQSRNPDAFGNWLQKYRSSPSSSSSRSSSSMGFGGGPED